MRPSVQPPAGRNEAALIQRLGARGKEKSEDGQRRHLAVRDLGQLGGLRLHVNNPGLRDLIGFSTSLHHIGQGPEFLVLAQRLQDLEHVLAGPIVSSSEKKVVLGRGKMSSREMVRNVRG